MDPEMEAEMTVTASDYAALIGIDWSDQRHDIALRETGATRLEILRIGSKPEELDAWIAGLKARFGGRKIAILLEQTRGALIHALLGHGCFDLYPVNPRTVEQFRKTFSGSGAKGDPTDAALMLELLEKHRGRLRIWKPDNEETRKLARLTEARRKVVNERTQQVQRLGAELKGYFPQALEWAGSELTSSMALDFLERWPSLQAIRKARQESIRRFYTTHSCRSAERINERLQQIRRATPLVSDEAIIEPGMMMVQVLVAQIRVLNQAIERYDERIKELFAQHPDAELFRSLPGGGPALAPRLLAALGTDRNRFESAATVQRYCGIAPVTEASGKSRWVHFRWAAPKFARQTFHEFAGQSLRWSVWARAFYEEQRARGKGHHAAVRAVAFKWIRIIWRCWKDRTPYDESRYLESLRRRGSPLVQRLQAAA
jgi:transposase